MKKAKNITLKPKLPESGTDEYRQMLLNLQLAGMSYGSAVSILKGTTNIQLGTAVQAAAAFGVDGLDDLIHIEWE